jgi:hypothetical protein
MRNIFPFSISLKIPIPTLRWIDTRIAPVATCSQNISKTRLPYLCKTLVITNISLSLRQHHGKRESGGDCPWTGFLVLFFSLLAAIAMAVVLRVSNGKEVTTWKLSPSLYLNIVSTVANVLLVFALARATEVAFGSRD